MQGEGKLLGPRQWPVACSNFNWILKISSSIVPGKGGVLLACFNGLAIWAFSSSDSTKSLIRGFPSPITVQLETSPKLTRQRVSLLHFYHNLLQTPRTEQYLWPHL